MNVKDNVKKDYKVYKRENIITKKVYIGITHLTLEERAGVNFTKYLQLNESGNYKHPKFAAAILKYGPENFKSEIIKDLLSLDEAIELEKIQIEKYNSFFDGYNSSPGGEYIYDSSIRVVMVNPETEEVILSFKSATEAIKFVNLKNNTNIIRCCKGTAITAGKYNGMKVSWRYESETESQREERIANLEISRQKNQKRKDFLTSNKKTNVLMFYADNTEEIIREFNSLREGADFVNIKNATHISDCCKGKRNYAGTYNGKRVTWRYSDFDASEFKKNSEIRIKKNEERYQKISESKGNKKSVIGENCKTGEIIEFDSITEAAKFLGMKNGVSISSAIKGKQKQSGGYYWRMK